MIETVVITAVCTGMLLYFVVFLLVLWTDREYVIGRDDTGRARARREIRRPL